MRLREAGWPLSGASDHLVSEALYLHDPDGNGIEIYWDRDPSVWPRSNGADRDGDPAARPEGPARASCPEGSASSGSASRASLSGILGVARSFTRVQGEHGRHDLYGLARRAAVDVDHCLRVPAPTTPGLRRAVAGHPHGPYNTATDNVSGSRSKNSTNVSADHNMATGQHRQASSIFTLPRSWRMSTGLDNVVRVNTITDNIAAQHVPRTR